MQTKTKPLPTTPDDIAMSVALGVAELMVRQWTPEKYSEQRDRLNSLPGVRIVSLPRDKEFGYVKEQS
jgi:hypothetical protein